MNLLFSNRSGFLSDLFLNITYLGSNIFIVFLSAVVICALIISRKKYTALVFAGSIFATGLSVYFIKILVSRVRPDSVFALYLESSPSFPSGHSAMSLCLYGLLAYLAVLLFKKKYQKVIILIISILLIVLIGFSRVYLGVHYSSDVLAGFIVAVPWLLLGAHLIKNLRENKVYLSW